jgi:hypothetical protein
VDLFTKPVCYLLKLVSYYHTPITEVLRNIQFTYQNFAASDLTKSYIKVLNKKDQRGIYLLEFRGI